MEYSRAWLRFYAAEDEYFISRQLFVQNEEVMLHDLKRALTKAGDNQTALRLLLALLPKAKVIIRLLADIIDAATDSSDLNTIALARGILHHYKSEIGVRSTIQTLVATYLSGGDEWHCRRIAELYKLLDYKEELDEFLSFCRASANPEVQEIAKDFML